MSRILKSLFGPHLGLDPDNALIVPGGIKIGEHGSQFSVPSSSRVVFFDDFHGDVIADEWNLVEGTDSATSNAAVLAGGIGGLLRITTGDAGTGLAADMPQLNLGILAWQASNGNLVFETRIQLSQITEMYVFLGFTDKVTLEAPIISAGAADTITTTAADAVGFMFDTRMSTDTWWLTGVANNTDATHVSSGFAPVAATNERLRIEISSTGVATFYRNGTVIAALAGAVTPATDLTPTIAVGKLSTASTATADVDYVYVAMDR